MLAAYPDIRKKAQSSYTHTPHKTLNSLSFALIFATVSLDNHCTFTRYFSHRSIRPCYLVSHNLTPFEFEGQVFYYSYIEPP